MKHAVSPFVAILIWSSGPLWAQEPKAQTPAETAVRQCAPDYVQAFNAHDSKALANQWSPEAVYLDRSTGEEIVGREAIAEHFDDLFMQEPDLKLEISVESIRFLSPNVAVEQGTSKFLSAESEPEEVDYTAVYVQREGQWLLDRVTDDEQEVIPSNYEQLKVLEWLVGNWVDQDELARIDFECHWAKNQNFLVRSFAVVIEDRINMSGVQIIGWDAAANCIRSWTFDSDGGFAEAIWTRQADQWFISNKGQLADGRMTTMVNIVKPVDENSFTWQTVERTAGGELLPNIDEVVIVRD